MDLREFRELSDRIVDTVGDVFVGERLIVQKLLAAALANGHVLFEDYPGLGKTLLVKNFARTTGCDWGRVQFTPDLMPSDITGTRVWKGPQAGFSFEKGPLFTNILLADEINRSPPKTQSALLEAMEERQVTVDGVLHQLKPPFFVIATQNPIELEGTFSLPEAQLDRFMLKMSTGYVQTLELESEILRRRIKWKTDDPRNIVSPAVDQETFIRMQNLVEDMVYADDQIIDYVSRIVRATREHPAVEVGSSPRGALSLLKVSRSMAAMCGRDFVTPDDVKLFVREALGHRILLKIEYEIEGKVTPESIVSEIVSGIEPPRDFMRK
ncbi:AAA family ATPase [Methanocella sp. MCL-LM]|uniref:AAA family ATPase n=1 Tax=Methanocella sp. MCL-LM TaxID=3412035 RepID=UPI003C768037